MKTIVLALLMLCVVLGLYAEHLPQSLIFSSYDKIETGTPANEKYCEWKETQVNHSREGQQSTIVDTLYFERELFPMANMYIWPYADPLNDFIVYGSPHPTETSDFVGDGYSFYYHCNTSSRLYCSTQPQAGPAGYSLLSVTFNVFQINCYSNLESQVFPIWYDGDPHYLMLAHVQYELPFHSSSFYPDFVQNIGVISRDNTVGWRTLDVTEAYNATISNSSSNRDYFQLMLYFEILTDWDYMDDCVMIGNPNHTYAPHLVLTYTKDVSNQNDVIVPVPSTLIIYPNPFNPSTTIDFSIPQTGRAKLSIFNIRGQKVKTLLDGDIEKGQHRVVWNGRDDGNRSVASGVYFIRLEAAGETSIRKAMLLK
ncbi:MAG: T9SS type A sorting domain-containing protein [Candidatus Cloacimonadaceae bacterium]|nr:T9SS type A sorting domain-containing protein [Candidatus Cloacimonadota bacterium]MCK9179019.1 T9SS type A sorting domain-containing protein [Candidatus Cloacimonadota bacterium]MDY0127023.1 T9SS type A sorting domain-containing protein [Candidatus Cloacimonadaceae bacterium]